MTNSTIASLCPVSSVRLLGIRLLCLLSVLGALATTSLAGTVSVSFNHWWWSTYSSTIESSGYTGGVAWSQISYGDIACPQSNDVQQYNTPFEVEELTVYYDVTWSPSYQYESPPSYVTVGYKGACEAHGAAETNGNTTGFYARGLAACYPNSGFGTAVSADAIVYGPSSGEWSFEDDESGWASPSYVNVSLTPLQDGTATGSLELYPGGYEILVHGYTPPFSARESSSGATAKFQVMAWAI